MRSIQVILFGIAVILVGIAASTMNFFGWLGGGIGILVCIAGLCMRDGGGGA